MISVLKGLFFCEAGETCGGGLADLYETGDDLVFEMDLPGVDLAQVSVRVYEHLLIIDSGQRTGADVEMQPGQVRYLCVERSLKGFRRLVKLPVPVNTVAGKAWYHEGVLTVTFPRLKGKIISIAIEKQGN
jgi:HSP20 family protein